MIKLIAQFEHTIEGKIFRCFMDHDTSLPIAKEMCFAFLKHLGAIEDQAKAQAEAASQSETKHEEAPASEENHVE